MNFLPTTSAIETAVKNASRDAKNYSLIDTLAADGVWMVAHKSGDKARQYIVNTNMNSCTCEAYLRSGVCKHQKMVDDEVEIRFMETMQEDGEYLLECSREHLVGFAAEVMADTWAGLGA
jgi:hypothetical protein